MEAHFMSRARYVEPLLAGNLVVADDASHAFGENFSAAARHRIHAGIAQLFERLANAQLRAVGEESDLDHGEGLQMNLRVALLQAAQHLAIPIERQFRMQAADNVKL